MKVKERKVKEIDIYKLSEEREREVKRTTRQYRDMKNFTDWARLMIEKPGFYRD